MQETSQRFTCSGCGDCCRGRFAIIVTDEDKKRIERQGWTDDELKLGGKRLFTRAAEGYQLAHRPDGSCVFLNEKGLCEIHARHGEAAKPVACRLYPFKFVPLGNQVRVDVRYDCPTVAANKGRPFVNHRGELQELVKKAVPADEMARMASPRLHGNVAATWPLLGRITESIERVLADISLDITRRVAACAAFADLLRESPVATLNAARLEEFLGMAEAHVQENAALDALFRVEPGPSERLSLRQILVVYGRIDTVGEKPQIMRRLMTSLAMASGKGAVPPLRAGLPQVAFADVEKPRGVPAGDAALAVERYLQTHLGSMGFFGQAFYNRPYLEGLSALLLTYPLICWFARVYAISEGRETLSVADIERAVAIVDHNHGVAPALDIPTERMRMRMLCEPANLRSLIVWYGS